jgi:hypothetical protein
MNFKDMCRDALRNAEQGDYRLLIFVARAGRLDRLLQRFVANIFETKKFHRKRGRPPDSIKKYAIRDYVQTLRQSMAEKPAVSIAAEKFGLTEAAVRAALKSTSKTAFH